MSLSPDEIRRFSRSILLRPVGGSGQNRWLESRVRVIGSCQSPLAEAFLRFLTRAGVGSRRETDSGVAETVVAIEDIATDNVSWEQLPSAVAVSGALGTAIVLLGGEGGPCSVCRHRSAHLAVTPLATSCLGPRTLGAAAFLASQLLRVLLGSRFPAAAADVTLFRDRSPFVERIPVAHDPRCARCRPDRGAT